MADKKEWTGGEVLFAGGTDFALVGDLLLFRMVIKLPARACADSSCHFCSLAGKEARNQMHRCGSSCCMASVLPTV